MATLVKSIEREFLLSQAYREQAAIVVGAGGGEWSIHLVEVDRERLVFVHEIPLHMLKRGDEYDFRYNIRDQTIAFRATLTEPGQKRIAVRMPDKVYRNQSRRFTRMQPPAGLSASFSFAGERYELDFPSTSSYNPADAPVPSDDFDATDLRGLMAEFERKASALSDEHGIVMFRDRKPETLPERMTATTGLCLYIPSVMAGIPKTDPFERRTILIRQDFIEHFLGLGMEKAFAEDEVVKFERSLRGNGIHAQLIVPIVFQDYTIGYALLTGKTSGSFDLSVVNTFVTFSRVFAWSLRSHGYFRSAPRLGDEYQTQVVDISAGGLLFASSDGTLSQALRDDLEVDVRLTIRKRTIDSKGVIRRQYAGQKEGYFGLEFRNMAPENFRYLYESLYGRPYNDEVPTLTNG